MPEEQEEVAAPETPFVCAYCRRRFTKKEHLKRHERAHTGSRPFKCTICGRGFSRGDVLSRHVKGHKQAARTSETSASETPGPRPFSEACSDERSPPVTINGVYDPVRNANAHPTAQNIWPSLNQPENSLMPKEQTSSLLWPDSEGFFQTLVSGDGINWDHVLISQPEQSQDNVASVGHCSAASGTRDGELATVEDGHRAVQTINSLLTNTLFNVTFHVEISDLTPRFLDSSLHMFFTKFIPILPIIHQPTFVYRDCSAQLLLNAIAIGSLFLGTEDATVKGEALWRLAYTAIATSWSGLIGHRREYDACSGVELVLTALLSQTYAALSKNRELRMTSQTFYGLSMHWAQYCGMYDIGSSQSDIARLPGDQDPIETKMHAWRTWVARESTLRTLLGLCVIDGVVSQFSGNLVNTCSATKNLPLAAPEEVFAADSVDKWIHAMRAWAATRANSPASTKATTFHNLHYTLISLDLQLGQSIEMDGLLNIKIVLQTLAFRAVDVDDTSSDPHSATQKYEAIKALAQLRSHIIQSENLSTAEKAVGLLRWHAICLDLFASTARGARRMCHYFGITQHIFGGKKRQESAIIEPERWASKIKARKNLLHAMEIHRIASEVPLGVIHDTCLPGALFAAATTYSSFALLGVSKIIVPTFIDWETVLLHGLGDFSENPATPTTEDASDTMAFLLNSVPTGWTARNLMYELGGIRILLHSLSQHWGVAREMEKVIGAWEARCGG